MAMEQLGNFSDEVMEGQSSVRVEIKRNTLNAMVDGEQLKEVRRVRMI